MTGGIRTHDHRDHNPGLYQLSYGHRATHSLAAPVKAVAHADREWNGLISGAGPQGASGRPSADRCAFRLRRGVTLLVRACSSAEERRPSKPRVGGSNPSRRVLDALVADRLGPTG